MTNTVRIKRRAAGGASGAPASLENAELAYNEQDDTLYYGKGTGGAGGSATSVIAIAGPGTYARLDSPAFTGTPTAPTASADTGTTQLATTEFVLGQASSTAPLMDGTAATGTSKKYARADHVHATDTSRAPIDSPALTGTPTAPTPVTGDNSVKIATTAFVKAQAYITQNDTITLSGDATGSGRTGITVTLKNTGTAGQYTKVTTDAQGRVTAGDTLAESDIPTLHAAKVTDFDAQVRSSRLDQMATPTADVDMGGHKITGVATPVNGNDAANKDYVDMTVQGLDPKGSVKAATVANIASLSGTMTIDGVALSIGDRVLVKDQTAATQNGIYVVAAGAWTRSTDADAWAKLPSAYVFAEQGSVNAEMGFICTADAGGTLGTTPIIFQQFSGAGQVLAGAGMTKTGNTLDVGTADSGRIVINSDSIDLALSGIVAGYYTKLNIDAYGRAIGGSNPTTLAGYGIVDAQALDATLTALAAITTAADKLIYATGADTFATTDFPSYGRSLAASASAAAARSTLGLGTMATQNANNVAITGGTIDGITFDGGAF